MTVRGRLESILTASGAKRKLAAALDEMARVVALVKAMGIHRRVMFRPSMARNAEVVMKGNRADT